MAKATWGGLAPCARAALSSPPVLSAMAKSGPKGRGVNRGSQVPHNTACGRGSVSRNEPRRAVLPTPASPPAMTTAPRPLRPTEASASSSTLNGPARSSSSSDRPGTAATTTPWGMPNGAPGRAEIQPWPDFASTVRKNWPRYFGTHVARDNALLEVPVPSSRPCSGGREGPGQQLDRVGHGDGKATPPPRLS